MYLLPSITRPRNLRNGLRKIANFLQLAVAQTVRINRKHLSQIIKVEFQFIRVVFCQNSAIHPLTKNMTFRICEGKILQAAFTFSSYPFRSLLPST